MANLVDTNKYYVNTPSEFIAEPQQLRRCAKLS